MKQLSLLFSLLFLCNLSYSQGFLGGNTKIILAKLDNTGMMVSYSFGATYRQKFKHNIFLQSGLNYSRRGGSIIKDSFFEINTLESPFLFGVSTKHPKTTFDFLIGPYLSYSTSILEGLRYLFEGTSNGESFKQKGVTKSPIFQGGGIQSFDFGLNVIVGPSFKVSKYSRLCVYLEVNRGLMKISPLEAIETRFSLSIFYIGKIKQ